MSDSEYHIPDLLVTWPWKRGVLNPMLPEVNDEVNAWVESLGLLDPVQLKKFHTWNFNLLGALIAPIQTKEHLRITCDLMNLFFAFDEFSDVRSESEVKKMAIGVMDAFRSREGDIQPPHAKLTEMAHQFIQRTVSVVGEDVLGMERFVSDFDTYVNSVVLEAEDRTSSRLRTVNDYITLRRDTCGAKPTFSFLGLGLNIPNEVFEHPVMISLIENANDLIAILNDIHSYGLECVRELHGHNIITAILPEFNLDLQQAFFWLSGYAYKTISNFLSNSRALPSWGEKTDQAVKVYIDRVAGCVRGADAWCYETNRYHREHGSKVQEHRKVTLLSPDAGYSAFEHLELEAVRA